MVGIYMIKNIINDKKYIGQSSDIHKRWKRHIDELNNNTHHNIILQNAWNKYGEENFNFIIIEECLREDLDNREIYYINLYKSNVTGYNLDCGGKGCSGYKHSEEEIEKMRRIQQPLVVLQFDLNFNLVNEFIGGPTHAGKVLGYTRDCIKNRCERTCTNLIYKNSYWIYKHEYENENFSWNKYLNFEFITDKPQKEVKYFVKISQYDKNKNFIKTWNSYKELKDNGFDTRRIQVICKQKKNQKTYAGFIWVYEDYDFSDGYFDSIINPINPHIEACKKKVRQIDKNGDIICTYLSAADAARHIGCSLSKVSVAAVNHKICKGFAWAYENDDWFNDKKILNQVFENSLVNIPKSIIQLDLNGNILKVFDKIKTAAEEVGTDVSNICRAAKYGKTSAGFKWQYNNRNI